MAITTGGASIIASSVRARSPPFSLSLLSATRLSTSSSLETSAMSASATLTRLSSLSRAFFFCSASIWAARSSFMAAAVTEGLIVNGSRQNAEPFRFASPTK